MKAYELSAKDDSDQGSIIVFSENSKEAKKNWTPNLETDSYIDRVIHRASQFDGMENATDLELATKQWQEGWVWYDEYYPDVETQSVEDFKAWFINRYKAVNYEENN